MHRRPRPFLRLGRAAFGGGGGGGTAESVDFDGSAEYLANTTAGVDFALGPNHSVALWLKKSSLTNGAVVLDLAQDSASVFNLIRVETSGTQLIVEYYNSSGALRKRWGVDWAETGWTHFVFTWDDSEPAADRLSIYKDGSPATVTKHNDSGVLRTTASNEEVTVGQDKDGSNAWAGRVFSAALWSATLSASEVSAIYNSGDGAGFDLTADSGSYASSADLEHLWNVAENVRGNETDLGNGTAVDVTADGSGITTDDVVTDAPS